MAFSGTATQHANGSSVSGPKLLSAPEGAAFLVGCALWGFASAALGNALQRHADSAGCASQGSMTGATQLFLSASFDLGDQAAKSSHAESRSLSLPLGGANCPKPAHERAP